MSRRTITRRWIPALGLVAFIGFLGVLASCDSDPGVTSPGEDQGPSYEVYDGSAIGTQGFEAVNPHFFFLPPVVSDPVVSGIFDPHLKVQIEVIECDLTSESNPDGSVGFETNNRRICYPDDGVPKTPIKTFGSELIQTMDEYYQVNWHTDESAVQSYDINDPSQEPKFYRIGVKYVWGGGLYPLGHVDVQFGANGKEAKNINQSDAGMFGLNDGRTLPIKFRIERGAAAIATAGEDSDQRELVEGLLDGCLEDPTLLDCDVRVIVPDPDNEQPVVVWAEDDGVVAPAGVVTFTKGSIPETDEVVALVEYRRSAPPSPEIEDGYEIPPFLNVELWASVGVEYTTPLAGDGARVAWCHDLDDDALVMDKYAIYQVDDDHTVLLETGDGGDCEYVELLFAATARPESSLLDIVKNGLSEVASLVVPEPLRAMHGGLNTEGPIRKFSEFGAVVGEGEATVAGGDGWVGTPTYIAIKVNHPDYWPGASGDYAGDPLGGHAGEDSYVGGRPAGYRVDPPEEYGPVEFVTLEVVSGDNADADITGPYFDPETGYYTASYTPLEPGTDQIEVRIHTRTDQVISLESQVYELPAAVDCSNALDCDAEPLDFSNGDEELTVWVDSRHPAAIVRVEDGAIPEGYTAVLEYIHSPSAPEFYPSPEIPDTYEIPPFISVDIYDQSGNSYFDNPQNELGGEYGVEVIWCHDLHPDEDGTLPDLPSMEDLALYKVDDGHTVLLETGQGSACLTSYPLDAVAMALPGASTDNRSLLGVIRDRLGSVAGLFKPEPLRAMHGGLNTEGPIRKLSDFGAVFAIGENPDGSEDVTGYVGEETTVRAYVRHPNGYPVGGDQERPYVGGKDDEQFVTIELAAGPNYDLTERPDVIPLDPYFDEATGAYRVQYTPIVLTTAENPDVFTVTVNTYEDQEFEIYSVVSEMVPAVWLMEGDPGFDGEDGRYQVGSAGTELTYPAKARLVVDGTGEPLPGVTVEYWFRDREVETVFSATTDTNGYISIPWQLGDYGGSNVLWAEHPTAGTVEWEALALGQVAKWTADGATGWEDVVGGNDIPDQEDDATSEAGRYGAVSIAPSAGVIGGAFYFGPSGGYITVPAKDAFSYGDMFQDPLGTTYHDNDFTYSAWVKLEPGLYYGDYQHFLQVGPTMIEGTNSGVPGMPNHFKVYTAKPVEDPTIPPWNFSIFGDQHPLQTGCYYHVAATLDGSTLRAYLNGEAYGEIETPSLSDQGISANQAFFSHRYPGGVWPSGANNNIVGWMDEIEIWNTVLDGDAITSIYDAIPDALKCQTYALRGRVLYANQVKEGVVVNLETAGGVAATTTSGEYGDYTFDFGQVQAGNYWVRAVPADPYIYSTGSWVDIGSDPVYHDIQIGKPVVLLAPANGETVTSVTPTLEWDAIPEADHYNVRIIEAVGDAVVLGDLEVPGTSYTVDSDDLELDLTPGVEYRWHVSAYDEHYRIIGVTNVDFFFTVESAAFACADIPATECDALVALYESTSGDGWTTNTGWMDESTPAACSWHGVTCDLGHVVGIDIQSNNLTGTIPSEIGQLTSLTQLNLRYNQITGGIPASIGNLLDLQVLHLGDNDLDEAIPPEIGGLSSLTGLYLQANRIPGPLPTQLGDLSNLTDLGLNNNALTDQIPFELGQLSNLETLNLSLNQLQGGIPESLGSLGALTNLGLAQNPNLGGTIPAALGNLSSLHYLYLNNSGVTGTIPPELGNLGNLFGLGLGSNQLSGAIPSTLGNLTSLIHLRLSDNDLSGLIPPELGDLPVLEGLSLQNNNLEGEVPLSVAVLGGKLPLDNDCDLSGNPKLFMPDNSDYQLADQAGDPGWICGLELGNIGGLVLPEGEFLFMREVIDTNFYVGVANWVDFDNKLFARLSDGASRTRVRVMDASNGDYLNGFTQLRSNEALYNPPPPSAPWFSRPFGIAPPRAVYIELYDRYTDNTVRSNDFIIPLTAAGTPTIDGVKNGTEWENASKFTVTGVGGTTEGGTLYVMNDNANLYLAFEIADGTPQPDDQFEIRFDNDLDGVATDGDDHLLLSGPGGPGLRDAHFVGSSWGVSDGVDDQDGIGVAGQAEGISFFELSHPLSSGDGNDFALSLFDHLGFCVRYFNDNTSTSAYPSGCLTDVSVFDLIGISPTGG